MMWTRYSVLLKKLNIQLSAFLLLLFFSLGISFNAHAGTLVQADMANDARYTDLANTPQYDSVGAFTRPHGFSETLGTGTLINNRTILTAAHVFDDSTDPFAWEFNFGPSINNPTGTIGVSDIFIHPDYDRNNLPGTSKFDIALVELATPTLGITPSEIYRGDQEDGATVTLVGYGRTGTGFTGDTLDGGTKRAGTVQIDSLVHRSPIIVGDDTELRHNMDNPADNTPAGQQVVYPFNEIHPAPGDSGGPLFLNNQIAGVVSRNTEPGTDENGNDRNNAWGSENTDTRVSFYEDWVDDNLYNSVLYKGFGGEGADNLDFGNLAMSPNDDGSSNELGLPFDINFYGNTFDSFWVNNNGNLTFESSLWGYTPEAFPVANQTMIAPYWGDVDTRGTGNVYVGNPDDNTVVITWENVGYYPSATNKTNTFQAVLTNRDDINAGDFDIEFRYDNLEWTTGGASGGTNGLGGTEAQAGFDAGDSTNFFTLPGSRTPAVLNLTGDSNTDVDGYWQFAIRSGETPGQTPENPLMPVVRRWDADDNGIIDDNEVTWTFDFNIGDIDDQIFIDPVIAIGYEYVVESGPNFRTVLLPDNLGGDNLFDLWFFSDNLGDYFDTGVDIGGGVEYDFGVNGVDRFVILGIEAALGLDPQDATAFVTGLTFTGTGLVQMTQTPITYDTDAPAPVPEPNTMLLFGLGLLGLTKMNRRKSV